MKRNILIIAVVVVVVLVVAGYYGLEQVNARAATTAALPTATVTRGTLVATVSAAGNVSVPQQAALAFQSSGRVAKVNVAIGNKVKSGQVLMELDTSDLQLALKTAQSNLASAQANYTASQTNLALAVKTAQNNLASAQANYDSEKIKAAQAPNQLIVAKAALDKATVALEQAQAAYDPVAWRPDIGMMPQAAALQSASSDYQSALATYKITASGINDTSLRTAQASLDNAQTALQQAQAGQDTSLQASKAALDNAQVAVTQAQQNLAKAQIVAPFDGTIAAVNYNVGDTAGSSTAVSVATLSTLQVKVSVAEVDVANIKVGENAIMTLDALPGNSYPAQVADIGPVGTVTQGVVNYPVTVAVTNPDPSVLPGMTANLAIQVNRRDNVLYLPIRAVRTQGNQKLVTALYKGQQIPVPVQIGLENDTSVEIVSGLQEGDVVLLNQTQTRQVNAGGIPLLGGGGFGGR